MLSPLYCILLLALIASSNSSQLASFYAHSQIRSCLPNWIVSIIVFYLIVSAYLVRCVWLGRRPLSGSVSRGIGGGGTSLSRFAYASHSLKRHQSPFSLSLLCLTGFVIISCLDRDLRRKRKHCEAAWRCFLL